MTFIKTTAIAAICMMCAGVAQAATFSYEALLDGAQAVPGGATPSTATGVASMTLDDSDESLTFTMQVDGISTGDLMNIATFGPVHIHRAAVGATGPVAVPFIAATDPGGNATYADTGTGFLLTSARILFADLGLDFGVFRQTADARGYYINVHTQAVGSGEIRGQLSPVPLPAGALLLMGALGGLGAVRRAKKAA